MAHPVMPPAQVEGFRPLLSPEPLGVIVEGPYQGLCLACLHSCVGTHAFAVKWERLPPPLLRPLLLLVAPQPTMR